MRRILILSLLAASCFAQSSQEQHQVQTASATSADAKLAAAETQQNQAKARDLLQLAESESRGLEPGMRALTLSQIGAAYVGVDQKKATALLHDAFTATTEMDPDSARDKRFLQGRILSSLLGLEGDAVAELLPRAEPDTRSDMMGQLIARAAQKKDFARAGELVNQAAADSAKFPYSGVTQFMLALPPEATSERLNAFLQAYTAYSRDPNADGVSGSDSFDRMIVRFGGVLPKETILKAIDEILNSAKDSANQANVTLSSSAGSASFTNSYDYYLFEFLPVLRRLDPSKADDLLKQDNALQGTISKFPDGVTSLDPTIRDTPRKPGENGGMSFSINSGNSKRISAGAAQNGASMQQIYGQYQAEVSRIQDLAAKDPRQALSQARNLPEAVGSYTVRTIALLGVARSAWRKEPAVAREALDDVVKSLESAKPDGRGRPLMDVADLYLKLDDSEAAAKTIDLGLKTAQSLYEADSNADDPNKALKGFWPSASLWSQCVALAFKAEPNKVPEILAGIKDDEIRTNIRIAYAMALTGNPPTTTTTMINRKGQNSMSINSTSR